MKIDYNLNRTPVVSGDKGKLSYSKRTSNTFLDTTGEPGYLEGPRSSYTDPVVVHEYVYIYDSFTLSSVTFSLIS